MSRIARVVVPELPHHVVQRGNRRQKTFFSDADRQLYLRLMAEEGTRFGVKFWAYCLMNNHVHLIAVPSTKLALADCVGTIHRKYSTSVNRRQGWTGYLWQGRFFSSPVEPAALPAVVRYVERNPVRARMVTRAETYPWSSASAHVLAKNGAPLDRSFLQDEILDWSSFLDGADKPAELTEIRLETRTGHPLGGAQFVRLVETMTSRTLERRKPGRPKKK